MAEKKIKVEAFRKGYFEKQRIRVGKVFLVSESEFSELWMKKLDGKPEKIVAPKKETIKKAEDKDVI